MGIGISFGPHSLQLASWDSEGEMREQLLALAGGHVVLGDSGYAREFYTVIVNLREADGSPGRFGVGVCSEGHGLTPRLLLRPREELLLFGFNREVCAVSVRERGEPFAVNCDGLVCDLVCAPVLDLILVVHEIGALAITTEGETRWAFTADVVTRWTMRDGRLTLEFMDAPRAELDVATGRRL